jgi:hypothetical protein
VGRWASLPDALGSVRSNRNYSGAGRGSFQIDWKLLIRSESAHQAISFVPGDAFFKKWRLKKWLGEVMMIHPIEELYTGGGYD